MNQRLPAIAPAAAKTPAAAVRTGTPQHTSATITTPRKDSRVPAASTRPERFRPFTFIDMIIPSYVRLVSGTPTGDPNTKPDGQ